MKSPLIKAIFPPDRLAAEDNIMGPVSIITRSPLRSRLVFVYVMEVFIWVSVNEAVKFSCAVCWLTVWGLFCFFGSLVLISSFN